MLNQRLMKKLAMFLIICTGGCSPAIRTYYDYNSDDKIQTYRSYTWEAEKSERVVGNPLYYSKLNDNRIKAAANDLLKVKGYVLTEQDPDLTLDYHMVVEERSILLPDPYGYMYGDYFMRPRADFFTYREGTLIIDFMNTKKKTLVWRGWAVAPMEVVLYEAKDTEVLFRSALTKIFQNLPDSESAVDSTVTLRE